VLSGGPDAAFVTWVWRPAAELPEGKNNNGEDTYREQLQGAPVTVALDVLGGAFLTLQHMLEPHTIPRADRSDWPIAYDDEADGYYPSPPAMDEPAQDRMRNQAG
jgi:hypothetical protein